MSSAAENRQESLASKFKSLRRLCSRLTNTTLSQPVRAVMAGMERVDKATGAAVHHARVQSVLLLLLCLCAWSGPAMGTSMTPARVLLVDAVPVPTAVAHSPHLKAGQERRRAHGRSLLPPRAGSSRTGSSYAV